jgi:CBS domain-containing protein
MVSTRGILKGLLVEEAMRRQVVQLPCDASLAECINQSIKFKVNAILVYDDARCPAGVISRTDIVGAFYGGLPIEGSRLMDIMNAPLITCFPDDDLGAALDIMRANGVHQLFVQGADPSSVIGVLSYSDVVALVYRFCRACPKGAVRRSELPDHLDRMQLLTVRDAMMTPAISCQQEDSLSKVIDDLMTASLGAVLIRDAKGFPVGVVSKTDIVVAYRHGLSLETKARSIMNAPVASCDERSLLSDAIRRMFLKDVRRLFTYAGDESNIVGVLSLTGAAQVRSGSCRACESSRIITAP